MADLKASVILNMSGNLSTRAKRAGDSLVRLGRRGQKAMRGLNGTAHRLAGNLGKLGNRYTGLAAGFAVGAGAKAIIATEERLERLGVQAKASTEQISGMWDSINEAARLPEIKVDPKQILSAIEQIVERTGDLEFARNNIENIGRAIQATGAQGTAIGGIVSEFQKMNLIKPDEVEKAFDILNAQGKKGAFTLQHLAALGPRVVAAYTASGRSGLDAIREMGAALQMIRQGTGSSEMAATAFEALMRTLQDASKVKKLQKGGIQVFDPKALKEGREVLRPINELMGEIIKSSGGKVTSLSKIFDAEAMRAFSTALSEYNRTGRVESLGKFFDVQAQGETRADSARIAKTASAAWENATSRVAKKFEDFMKEPVKRFSGAVDKLLDGDGTGLHNEVRGLSRSIFPSAMFPKDDPTPGLTAIQKQKESELNFSQAEARLKAAINNNPPNGRVVVEIQSAPGANARIKSLKGQGLEADNGLIMRGP